MKPILIRSAKLLIFILFLSHTVHSQDRFALLDERLKELSKETPGLNQKTDISVNGLNIQEFIRGVAIANDLNMTVDASLTTTITCNFNNIPVSDVISFICRKYDLDITVVGRILSIVPYKAPKEIIIYQPKKIHVSYDAASDLLTYDLQNDSLVSVVRELTKSSGKNVVMSSDLQSKIVNGYVQNALFITAMDQLAFANDLKITKTEDDVYLVEKKEKDAATGQSTQKNRNSKSSGLNLTVRNDSVIYLVADHKPISDVLHEVSTALNHDYFLFSDLKGDVTFSLNNLPYDDFLGYLLNGTDYTFRKTDSIYLIGSRSLEGLRETKVIALKFRTIDKIIDVIPADLKKGIDIAPFPDLNSFVVSGPQPRITEIENFLRQIDQVVPVVIIELMIVDVNSSKAVSTGISAGLGTAPVETKGTIFPTLDISLSTSSINNLIDGLNGFGSLNIGKVTPSFYLKLKAMEEQGFLRIRSTPKLATINGHEAKMSIGRTEYYLETSNNVIGSQNPQNIITQQYKSINADLAITINPIVSSDEQITLDVKVKQSSFTERISNTAPPGTITRDFQSLIRVKNEEMVVLGGLEEITLNDSGSGVPFLSRIPVIKWFFSSRTHSKSKNKLTVFVKPTVLY